MTYQGQEIDTDSALFLLLVHLRGTICQLIYVNRQASQRSDVNSRATCFKQLTNEPALRDTRLYIFMFIHVHFVCLYYNCCLYSLSKHDFIVFSAYVAGQYNNTVGVDILYCIVRRGPQE